MKEFFEKNKIFIGIIIAAFIIGGFIYLSGILSIGSIFPKEKTTPEIVRENINAVVLVDCLDKENNWLGSGSGFFISSDGKLVTNYHVIEGCDQIQVKLYNGGFSPVKEILGADKYRDVAVLKINGRDLPYVKLGDSDEIEIGEKVIAIGSALGVFENTVTEGIISATERILEVSPGIEQEFIQITTPISSGNSGGALLNSGGKTIGIPSLSFSGEISEGAFGENLNFAVPINDVKDFLFDELAYEVRSFTENAEYYYLAGILTEDEEEAIENFEKAIAVNDKYIDAYFELGLIYELREDYDKAIENFKRIVEIDSEYADAYNELGWIYYKKGLYDLEIEMFKKAVQLVPGDPDFHFNLATAYEDKGLYDLAITEYKKVIEITPNDEDAHLFLGILYIVQEDYNKAFQEYKILSELNPGQAGILNQLIEKVK